VFDLAQVVLVYFSSNAIWCTLAKSAARQKVGSNPTPPRKRWWSHWVI